MFCSACGAQAVRKLLRPRILCLIFAILVCLPPNLANVSRALAYSTPSGFTATDFATGFGTDPNGAIGPTGIAFDSFDRLLVMDYGTGYLYKFGATGGTANTDTQVNVAPIDGRPDGLIFGKDRHLYAALQEANEVVELDPYTGAIIRTVATGISCPTGIATDPLSGDLFVSAICGAGIVRISGFTNGPGVVTTYAPINVDGITFAPDGTLYAAAYDGDVVRIDGTNSATPGSITPLVSIPRLDGIAVAGSSDPSHPPFLFVNRNDGIITKVDLTTSPPTLTDIFTGGTRGDFVAVGPDGCLYATQLTSVVKLSNADGTCSLAPTSVVPSWVAPTPRDKTVFDVRVGSSQTFTVKAQAGSGGQGNITITHSPLPNGVTCNDTANPSNPAQVDCTVAPTTSSVSTFIHYS